MPDVALGPVGSLRSLERALQQGRDRVALVVDDDGRILDTDDPSGHLTGRGHTLRGVLDHWGLRHASHAVEAMAAACTDGVTGRLMVSGRWGDSAAAVVDCTRDAPSRGSYALVVRLIDAQQAGVPPVTELGPVVGAAVLTVLPGRNATDRLVVVGADHAFAVSSFLNQDDHHVLTIDAALPAHPEVPAAVDAAWRAGGALTLRNVPLRKLPVEHVVDVTAIGAATHCMLLLHSSSARDASTSPATRLDVARAVRLRRLALYDELTRLPNRNLLRDRLDNAVQRARRGGSIVAVAFVDIDDFKSVNDRFGHAVGDELLVAVSRRLRGLMRESDTAARLGGDEFVLLYEGLSDETELVGIINRHAAALRRPYALSIGSVVATASVGVVVVDARHASAEELLHEADLAMYEAKTRGRGRWVVFDENHHQHLLRTRELGDELRRAIPTRQLRLHYQPVVRLDNGDIDHCEALLRWRHRDLKLLTPGHFLQAAERAHLMDAVGAWVLYEATQQIERWLSDGLSIPVAVNVAWSQLGSAALPQLLDAALAQTGVPPHRLHFEIGTSTLSTMSRRAAADLRALESRGVMLGVDDFGAAPVSVTDLARFNISYVRIDRSVVHGMRDDAGVRVTAALIDLGHRLGVQVVAQGVHSLAQVEALRSMGCDAIQGYRVGRPRAAHTMDAILKGTA